MQLLSTLNSLDNVADGSTRKLLTTATSSGSGNAVTAVSISGDTLTYTKGESFTKASILPNDAGEIKTKYRIAQKGYTGGSSIYWYYPICVLPADNNSDYASVIISGRIGGWVNDNMSYISALCWNRSGDGISVLDIAGGASSMTSIWGKCDIVLYRDTTSKKTTVYLKSNSYFTFDLDFEFFQSGIEVIYDGTYITTTPSGTLGAQASTSNRRMEVVNSQAYVNGTKLLNSDDVSVSQTLTSGTEVGSITINGTQTKLYSPDSSVVNVSLSSPQQTYYLTGVQSTIAGTSTLYNSYISSTYTGVKYITSATSDGGALYVDDKEVVTGLYYEIS